MVALLQPVLFLLTPDTITDLGRVIIQAVGIPISLFAVVVILFVGSLILAPYRQRNEARIALKAELAKNKTEPTFKWGSQVIQRNDYYYCLISVEHIGGRSARNCMIQVSDIMNFKQRRNPGFSPFTLKWEWEKAKEGEHALDIPFGDTRRVYLCVSPVDIEQDPLFGGTGTIIIFQKRRTALGIRFIPASDAPPIFPLNYPPDTYYVTLRLSEENLTHFITQRFAVSIGEEPSTLNAKKWRVPASHSERDNNAP